MVNESAFLGLSEIIWQGIFGFLSTIIVAVALGFITIHWLSRQEALNEREGKILNECITAYLKMLDSKARINERTIFLDTQLSIRRELEKHGILTLKDRAAVEYPPFFESREKFHAILKSLDSFHINKLHLMGPKSYNEFIYVYFYMSKLDGYYKYLRTTPMPDGTLLDEATVDEIIENFLPKVGMVIDFDMVKMQADFERALVRELYKLKSCTKLPLKNEVKKFNFLYLRFSKTFYAINEIGFFRMLIYITAEKTGTPFNKLYLHFKANEYVVTPNFHEEEVCK